MQKRGCSMVVRDLEFATGTRGVAHPVVQSNLMLKILEVLQGRFAIVASRRYGARQSFDRIVDESDMCNSNDS